MKSDSNTAGKAVPSHIWLFVPCMILFLCGVDFCGSYAMAEPVSYGKHIIIVVDQCEAVQRHENTSELYDRVYELLVNGSLDSSRVTLDSDVPAGFHFDPEKDELSLYVSGMKGSGQNNMTGDYKLIHDYCYDRANSDTTLLFQKFLNSLIHFRKSWQITKEIDDITFGYFLDKYLKPMMTGKDSLARGIVTSFSQYLFQLTLLNSTGNNNVPSEEYYVLTVSRYRSSAEPTKTNFDTQVGPIFAGRRSYVKFFSQSVNGINKKFDKDEYKVRIESDTDDSNNPEVRIYKIRPKNSNGHISEFSRFSQTDYNFDCFYMTNSTLIYEFDSNAQVDSVGMSISSGKINDIVRIKSSGNTKSGNEHRYFFSDTTLFLSNGLKTGDTLYINYDLYSMIKTSDNSTMNYLVNLPYTYVLSSTDIVPPPTSIKYIILAIIVILVILFLYRWNANGVNRKIEVDFKVSPISKHRYMKVENNKALNYDCWYFDSVRKEDILNVKGSIKQEKKYLARKFKYSVEYQVDDIDHVPEFSFRPKGMLPNGENRKCGDLVPIEYNEEDGSFSFDVVAFLRNGQQPDWNYDNVLKVKIIVRVKLKGVEKSVSSHEYHFIVKPSGYNTDIWMAFDPGTTGSCVAFSAGGNPNNQDVINLVLDEQKGVEETSSMSPVFPSKIIIQNQSAFFTGSVMEDLKEPEDYIFGVTATTSANYFQSIKKLLGYSTPQPVTSPIFGVKKIKGQDLAHLIIKSLYSHTLDFIYNESAPEIKRRFFTEEGTFVKPRAIVAVPNNYTMVKVQEMVNTIVRLGKFSEVHYIYEAEATLMSYIRAKWVDLGEKGSNRLIMVYDMGGATINATLFKLCNITTENQNISNIDIITLSKIGYAVGGDDIDFALLKIIYGMPSVQESFGNSPERAQEHMCKYKFVMLRAAYKLKLDWIEKCNGLTKPDNITGNIDAFRGWVNAQFNLCEPKCNRISFVDADLREKDIKYLSDEVAGHKTINEFVIDYVRDAVSELLTGLNDDCRDLELILSGRSVLFPGIKNAVLSTISAKRYSYEIWDGFETDGRPDEKKLKTTVAEGACWYAQFSNMIRMNNDIVTSSFGFIGNKHYEQVFIPIIEKNERFGEDGKIIKKTSQIPSSIQTVEFYQMLGSDFRNIYNNGVLSKKYKAKANLLDVIYARTLTKDISDIEISVDNKGNFSYSVLLRGYSIPVTIESNPDSRIVAGSAFKTEITDENSEAYAFAAIKYIAKDENVTSSTVRNDHF